MTHRLLLATLLFATSCGRSGSGETPVKSQLLTAAEGGTVLVTASESAALAGTKLEVPPGALDKDTRLTVAQGTQDLVASTEAAGPVVVWGPAGTRFTPKARLTLPLTVAASAGAIAVVVREASGAEVEIPASDVTIDADGRASFLVGGFTSFQPRRIGGACPADAKLCPDGSSVSRTGPNCTFPECPGTDAGVVACTKDAKVCPDGSSVGRVGPSCEFAPCPCHRGGCSGQLCTDEQGAISTCEWRPEYACYQQAACERQPDGQCGHTPSAALSACLADAGVP